LTQKEAPPPSLFGWVVPGRARNLKGGQSQSKWGGLLSRKGTGKKKKNKKKERTKKGKKKKHKGVQTVTPEKKCCVKIPRKGEKKSVVKREGGDPQSSNL